MRLLAAFRLLRLSIVLFMTECIDDLFLITVFHACFDTRDSFGFPFILDILNTGSFLCIKTFCILHFAHLSKSFLSSINLSSGGRGNSGRMLLFAPMGRRTPLR